MFFVGQSDDLIKINFFFTKSIKSGIRPDPSKRTKHRFPSFRPSDADRIASCTSDENHYDEVYIN